MIKKFQRITNLGVFGAFQWDQEVVNANGQTERFQHINGSLKGVKRKI